MGFRESKSQPVGKKVKGSDKEWYVYDERLIQKSIMLCKDILARNKGIEPRNIVAHSDIAPYRKHDPGPLFPWERFAKAGIGIWPDLKKVYPLPCLSRAVYEHEEKRTEWLVKHLVRWGYRKPYGEVSAQDIIRAFQMHYRPTLIDGKADKETVRRLQALLCEYSLVKGQKCPCSINK